MEERFKAICVEPHEFRPIYHVSGFSSPLLPIITNHNPDTIQLFQWGLIPFWVHDEKTALTIRAKTLNARSETIFEKPSFQNSILKKRCLVIVDGFYEWRHGEGKKYPYYITLVHGGIFSLAGIWDSWTNKETGDTQNTFSIITTRANALLEKIHNTKKRMPVIIPQDREGDWLKNDVTRNDIQVFFEPYDSKKMKAHPVSKLISSRGPDTNTPEVTRRCEYAELKDP